METTDWFVYRCDAHQRTSYVNANPRAPRPGEPPHVLFKPCCEEMRIVDVADQHEFCEVLRSTIPET